jgi:hypothetical protein
MSAVPYPWNSFKFPFLVLLQVSVLEIESKILAKKYQASLFDSFDLAKESFNIGTKVPATELRLLHNRPHAGISYNDTNTRNAWCELAPSSI